MPIVNIRASSLPSLFDCPARFEATQIRHMRLPSSGKAVLGRAVHAATATFDVSRIEATGLTVDECAGAAVDVIHRPEEEVEWDDGLTPNVAEKIAIDLTGLYCRDIAPRMTYSAVEVTCEPLTITDLGISLTGTIDRVYSDGDDLGIADIKTGGSVVATDGSVKAFVHAYQLGVYSLLAESALGRPLTLPSRIIGLQTGKTARGQRAAIGTVEGAREALVGDSDTPGILQDAAALINGGLFHGNPKSAVCSPRYCPIFNTCKYRR